MLPLSIHFPGKLVFDRGCLQRIPDEIISFGATSILVVTIDPLLNELKSLFNALESSGMTVEVNTSIVQEPSFAEFNELLEKYSGFNPDVVVGIGGGSVLDIAKLLAAQIGNPQTLRDIVGIGLLKSRGKKLICMPTTSGTGSEVSPNAILVDETDNQKKGIISPFLVPDVVYVDPLLTLTVPPGITATTGLDALTHCLEAYTNNFAHPFIDLYAYEGMRLIGGNLVKAVKDGSDEEARTGVAMGSLLGGFCLGPVNTAGVHALSYPLGSTFHLAHGLSNALLLPYVMEFNLLASPKKYAEVAIALGCSPDETPEKTARKGIEKIHDFIRECGMPARLSEVGVPREAIQAMAVDALKIQRLLRNNPRVITEADAIMIYESAF
ncbi:iron-containing alcohol dehydrogenase [Segetibacter sp. 3557_3]|uniref:iron-containing alcohol dehydrogenase n=1 Tax=Segetibacter sp. 3557_3 TaxID=2547429 RepID=UPI001058727D|nr:iron-containing alcohol dehydrogenase [Segetibacter sp. 3557_3]TDH27475.1 iron-containing alcohol dehydrogenase [Segetibacter sp. 3557_3]